MDIKQKTNFMIIVYGCILILGIFVAFQGSNFMFMKGNDVVQLDGDAFFEPLSRHVMGYQEAKRKTFTATIDAASLSGIDETIYNIVIFRLASNGYEVYFNDHFAGVVGDYESGNSNLWNGISRIAIPKDWIQPTNELTIKNYSHYMTGLTSHPIYITTTEKALKMVTLARVYNHNAVMVSIGVSMLALLILLVLYLTSYKRDGMFLSLSGAMFFLAIYSLDYSTIGYLFVSYILYKKIIMISFWAATFCVSLGLKQLFNRTFPVVINGIGLLGIILMAIFSIDLIMFKSLYTYWYLTQVITVLAWIILVFKNLQLSIEARVFFSGFIILFIYSIINAFFDITGVFFSMNSTIFYTSVFSIMPLLLVYLDFMNNRQQLHKETLLKEDAYKKAVTDALTGVYNKHHLNSVLAKQEGDYSIVMFDIDNFKEVNDRFGHQGGDRVLQYITRVLSEYLREDDLLFRYGGDEFVIIMDCPLHVVYKRMEAFRKFVSDTRISYGMLEITTTISMGVLYVNRNMSDHKVLDTVDVALYEAKKNGKNRVFLAEELE